MQLSDRLAGQTLNLFKGFTVLLRYHHLKQVIRSALEVIL